ncbi:sulfurtransferase [Peribacillus sp. SCS-155]|uniref:sulfurtransferase n=1 Tax=Peribacillus sedimenti TaxID=3115297 RepID=UPI003906AA03
MFQIITLTTIFVLLAPALYRRYYPVRNIPCQNTADIRGNSGITILDIRDYNETPGYPGATNIPYAYMKRYSRDIAPGKLHVVASNRLELNLGVRYLLSKGFTISSYEITECPCKKGVLNHGM